MPTISEGPPQHTDTSGERFETRKCSCFENTQSSMYVGSSKNEGTTKTRAAVLKPGLVSLLCCYSSTHLAHADDEAVQDGASARDSPNLLEAHGHEGQRVRLLVFLVLKINQRKRETPFRDTGGDEKGRGVAKKSAHGGRASIKKKQKLQSMRLVLSTVNSQQHATQATTIHGNRTTTA